MLATGFKSNVFNKGGMEVVSGGEAGILGKRGNLRFCWILQEWSLLNLKSHCYVFCQVCC